MSNSKGLQEFVVENMLISAFLSAYSMLQETEMFEKSAYSFI